MFDFIVSGQIPGTQIEVTFQSVLAIFGLVFGATMARQITRQHRQTNAVSLEEITL